MINKLRRLAARLKKDVHTLCIAASHSRTPWYARCLVLLVVAYALSPIDLIPDFIPIVGLLDDLILLPLGIALAIRMIPDDVLQQCRHQSFTPSVKTRILSVLATVCVVIVWCLIAYWLWENFA